MPSFESHVRYATAAYLGLTLAAVLVTALGAPAAILTGVVVGYPATIAGAGFPDVDHPSSKPYLFAKIWLPRTIAAVTGTILVAERTLVIDLIELLPVPGRAAFIAGAVCTVAVAAVYRLTTRMIPVLRPSHRTVTHSITVGLGLAAVLGTVVTTVGRALESGGAFEIGLVVGTCFVVGVASHLLVDDELPLIQVDNLTDEE